jgi:hypothetical protein
VPLALIRKKKRREEGIEGGTNSIRFLYKMGLITYQNIEYLYYYSGYYSSRDALNI